MPSTRARRGAPSSAILPVALWALAAMSCPSRSMTVEVRTTNVPAAAAIPNVIVTDVQSSETLARVALCSVCSRIGSFEWYCPPASPTWPESIAPYSAPARPEVPHASVLFMGRSNVNVAVVCVALALTMRGGPLGAADGLAGAGVATGLAVGASGAVAAAVEVGPGVGPADAFAPEADGVRSGSGADLAASCREAEGSGGVAIGVQAQTTKTHVVMRVRIGLHDMVRQVLYDPFGSGAREIDPAPAREVDGVGIAGVGMAHHAGARVGREHPPELLAPERRPVGDDDHARVQRVADADPTPMVHRDPGRARGSVDEGVQHRPVRDGVAPVAHALGFAEGRGHRSRVEVVATDDDGRSQLTPRDELVDTFAEFRPLAVPEPADPRGQALKRDALGREADPTRERLVFGEQLEHEPVGPIDVDGNAPS